jgi:inositol monophosphatase 3
MVFWPYNVRLNPAGVFTFILISLGIYVLYTISSPSEFKRIPVDPIDPLAEEQQGIKPPRSEDAEDDPFQINLKKLLIACIRAAEAGGREVYRIRRPEEILKHHGMEARSKGLTKEGAQEMVTKGDLASHKIMVHGLSATFPGLQVISEEENHNPDLDDEDDVVKPFHLNHDPFVFSEELNALPHNMKVPMKLLTVWIDPLDATQEYTETNDDALLKYVTTMVCVALNGNPVIGVIHKPFEHKTYWGWKGQGVSSSISTMDRKGVIGNRTSIRDVIIVSRSHPGLVDAFIKESLGSDVEIVHAGGAGYKILQVMEGHADAYVHNTLIKKWDICAPNALIDSIDGHMSSLDGYSISYSMDDDVRHEAGLLAAASYSKHQKFFSKLKRKPQLKSL